MKIKYILSIIFMVLSFYVARSQGVMQIIPEQVCWTSPALVDSSLVRYWIISARVPFTENAAILGYVNAGGAAVDVSSGGTFSAGFCPGSSTFNGADGDWAFLQGSTVYDPIFRQGRTMIFTQDTTHGFRVDSTFQFNVDGAKSILDWQDGNTSAHDKGLFFRSSVVTASTAGNIINDDNKMTLASMGAAIHRRRLGILSFAGPDPVDGKLRHGAFISANVEDGSNWSATSRGTELGFYTTEQGDTIPQKVFNLKNDGRAYLNLYSLFDDGVPTTLLGNTSGAGPISHHIIGGTPAIGKVLTIDGAGTGIEWQSPTGGGGGQVDTLIAGTDISIDNTDPTAPIINSTAQFVESVTGTGGITVDNTDPYNPIVTYTGSGGQVDTLIAGTDISIDMTDPTAPIINFTGNFVESVTGSGGITVDNTDPYNPIVTYTGSGGQVDTLIAGADISIDMTDPTAPIINFTGNFVESVTGSGDIVVDNTDPYNPIITYTGSNGQVDTLIAGTDISIDMTDPTAPIINFTGNFVESVTGTGYITVDNTDPYNPIVTYTGTSGQVDTLIAGTDISIDNTDPTAPIINFTGNFVESVTGTGYITVDNTDPYNPIVTYTGTSGQVDTLIAGTDISIDNTDPTAPIINFTGNFVESVTGTGYITVDNTDPYNPIVNYTGTSGQVDTLIAGTDISIDNTDPTAPIINFTGTDLNTNIYNSNGTLPSSTIRTLEFGNDASRYRYLDPSNADQYFDLFNNSQTSGSAGIYILDDDAGSNGTLGELDFNVYGVQTAATATVKGGFASLINTAGTTFFSVDASNIARMQSSVSDYRIGNTGTPATLLQKTLTSYVVTYDLATAKLAYYDFPTVPTITHYYAQLDASSTAVSNAYTAGAEQTMTSGFGLNSTDLSGFSYVGGTGILTYSGATGKNFIVNISMNIKTSSKLTDVQFSFWKNGGTAAATDKMTIAPNSELSWQVVSFNRVLQNLTSGDTFKISLKSLYAETLETKNIHVSFTEF